MTPEALLAELETCTHSQRMRRMVELGQRLLRGQEPDLSALISGLADHESTYARLLALQSCIGSRDGAHVVRALADPSRTIRNRAVFIVPHACSDAEAIVALGMVRGRRVRARLVASLIRRGRRGTVDAFLDARIAAKSRPDPHAADLLPMASSPTLVRNLAAFREATSPLAWARLATWHPEVAAAELIALLGSSPTIGPRLRSCFEATLERIAHLRPEIAVDLVRRLLERGIEPTDRLVKETLKLLGRRSPGAVFDVLRERHESAAPTAPPGAFAATMFDKDAQRLGPDRLAFLIRHAWSTLPEDEGGRRWFLRLSPEDRAQVVSAWMREGQESWGTFLFFYVPVEGPWAEAREAAFQRWSHAARNSSGVIFHEKLSCLPADLRIREAKRHLHQVESLITATRERIWYARYLPFTEAQEYLATWLGHPLGEQRAEAIALLIGTVQFERSRMADALTLLRRAKNEQDPVRLAIFNALRSLPLGAFRDEHLEPLGGTIADALDAADLSRSTASSIEQLVLRLFRIDPTWGTRWFGNLLKIRGAVTSYGFDELLTEPDARTLAPALSEIITKWLAQERATALIGLASGLGKRLPAVPALGEALERLAAELPFVGVAQSALQLLYTHDRRRFVAIVPALVTADPSFAILALVAEHVSRHRQDLLEPLLGAAPMQGRFATGKTRWAVDFADAYVRWTPRQQSIHAETQAALLADPARIASAHGAIETLTRLVFVAPTIVLGLASDPRPPVRDLAVNALSRLDQGEGIPTLLEALGDARARIAVYALRKALEDTSEARVLEVLRAAPRGKVTVAKEIVRLLGALGGEEAFADLIAIDQPGLHRDVRIALLRALWDHLERPEAWTVLERAAADPEGVVAAKLFDIPADRLNEGGDARLSRLLSLLLVRPTIEGRKELLQRVTTLPLADVERHLFGACLAVMSSTAFREHGLATAAVFARMQPGETEMVAACIRALMTEPRVLREMLQALGKCIGPYAPHHRNRVARDTLDTLAQDPRLGTLHLWLSSLLLTWRQMADLLISLSSRDAFHFDLMTTAVDVVNRCAEPEQLEAALATQSDARLRRLALAALEKAASTQGWTPARRERLRTFRGDFSALVSGKALFVFPPDEP